jgi:hypothetical protein
MPATPQARSSEVRLAAWREPGGEVAERRRDRQRPDIRHWPGVGLLHSRTTLAHAITIRLAAMRPSAQALIAPRHSTKFGTLRSAKPSDEGPRPRAGEAEHGRVANLRTQSGEQPYRKRGRLPCRGYDGSQVDGGAGRRMLEESCPRGGTDEQGHSPCVVAPP